MMKFAIEYRDMKLGIAQLTDGMRKEPLAVIYAQGKSIENMQATIDLCASAFDLLNQRLETLRTKNANEIDYDSSENKTNELTNLAWYHAELEAGRADRITLE